MSSREDILQSIRRNTRVRYEKPDLSTLEHEALTYEDKLSKFCEVIKQVGGQAVILKDEENVNDVIKAVYPDAKRIASTIKEIKTGNTIQPITCSTFHPDDVEESGDLDGTDVAIVDGRIGVCENGAVWLTQDVEQRAVYFISEALVIILDRKQSGKITCTRLISESIQANMAMAYSFLVLRRQPISNRRLLWGHTEPAVLR